MGSSRWWLLNQATHSWVARSTDSLVFRCARRSISSALGGTSASGRRDLQHCADRLEPVDTAVHIDEPVHHFSRRSSSAWSKNALASFRISLARRSSLTSRSRS